MKESNKIPLMVGIGLLVGTGYWLGIEGMGGGRIEQGGIYDDRGVKYVKGIYKGERDNMGDKEWGNKWNVCISEL